MQFSYVRLAWQDLNFPRQNFGPKNHQTIMAQVAASSVNCPCPPASHLGHSIVVHRSSTFLQPFFMGVSVVPSFQLPFSRFS
jgi:hypothetical protein